MNKNPAVYVDGEPDNIEAVVVDSLCWLEFIQSHPSVQLSEKNAMAIERMIAKARFFAPTELEFRDREVGE